jgi:predicted ATPase
MLFEDAHWIDPTSMELLTLTVERIPNLPILLIVTTRPEFRPPWPNHAHVTTMPLTRLDRRHGPALVKRVAGGRALPEEVTKQILTRAVGVPLLVEQLTKTVIESGLLREQDGHYTLDQPLSPGAIPTTLHASVLARLDRSAPVRDVAQIGAVVGCEFSYELLSAVADLSQQKLDEALGELVRSELVVRRGEIPGAVYRFKHALVRDAAYNSLPNSRRAELHAAIAGALESRFPDVVEAEPETLAGHLTEAGLFDRAVRYWLLAGRNAAMRSANLEAIAHLQHGIDAVVALPEGPDRDRSELALQLALVPCLMATQGRGSSRAMATFTRAGELCERLGDPLEYLQLVTSRCFAHG